MLRFTLIIFCLGVVVFCPGVPIAAETISRETPYTLTESLNDFSIRNCRLQETEKLKEDAKKLSENFKAIFRDLSDLSKALIMPLVERIAEWIETNYSELSENHRKKLQDLISEIQKNLGELEDTSVMSIRKILNDLKKLIEQLENKAPSPFKKSAQEPTSI
ncbi:MAG: hypothetical protein U9O82_03360 [Thermodesulfobacteriota bacterium]|nr:hypothetical protein [Thermodesulfobacteriota bacterium]